jgi:hypothetical protein
MDSSSDNMDNNISVAPSRMGSNCRSDIIHYTNRNTITLGYSFIIITTLLVVMLNFVLIEIRSQK